MWLGLGRRTGWGQEERSERPMELGKDFGFHSKRSGMMHLICVPVPSSHLFLGSALFKLQPYYLVLIFILPVKFGRHFSILLLSLKISGS